MSKRVLLVGIFLLLPYAAYSITTLTVQETGMVRLQLNVTDPDAADKLAISYSPPLNENGEWQTGYGDAGEYQSAVTVSDGTTSVSQDILIIVKRKEMPPAISSFSPQDNVLSVDEGSSIDFSISALDLNKDELGYVWFLDGKEVGSGQYFHYDSGYGDAGSHNISAVVFDMAGSVMREWKVNVANVDVESSLEQIKDVTVNEGEIVKLDLPDFEKYGLAYSISEPLGNDNEWKTTYKDAGFYDIEVHAEGKGFSKDKIVKVVVNPVDLAPVFENVGNMVVNENEEIRIMLTANDPDGDNITYSANDLPRDANLEYNIFTWKPGYDTVKKEDFVSRVLDKFGILSKSFYIQFAVSSKDKKIVQNAIITVKDANRAPVLEDIGPININEGETLKIIPNAYDLDGDKVSLSYSGFIDSDTFKSGYDNAGTYYAKVTASDGLLETSKSVQINIKQSNRQPLFSKIEDIKANEGEGIAILLTAKDPDGDEIYYFVDNPPEGAYIKGNAFFWTPDFNAAGKGQTRIFDLVFAASDSKSETRQIAKVEIKDKNRAPKIVDASKDIIAKVNEPVLMFVKATDEDNDELAYTWDFGILEKYKATATHQRTFTSAGAKAVKVVVSDGINEAGQVINVNVI